MIKWAIGRNVLPGFVCVLAICATPFAVSAISLQDDSVDDYYAIVPGNSLDVPAPGLLGNDCCSDQDGGFEARVIDPSIGSPVTGPVQLAHGTVTANIDGSFTYVNQSGQVGDIESFEYVNNPAIFGAKYRATAYIKILAGDVIDTDPDSYKLFVNDQIAVSSNKGLLYNDVTTTGGSLSVALDQPPQLGTVTVNSDGSFTYAHDSAAGAGTDSFTYVASDGVNSAPAETVQVEVQPSQVTGQPDSYQLKAKESLVVDAPGILENDSGANLSASLVSGPSGGTLSLNADGSFTYVNSDATVGSDSFSYTATDGYSTSAPQTVTLTVLRHHDKSFVDFHPNTQRGYYGRGSAFFGKGITKVNLFNGNLVGSLPLGMSYPVSKDLNYQLTLHYNSAVWSLERIGSQMQVQPWPFANAGQGWMLTFGVLLEPVPDQPTSRWTYIAPDGTAHRFFATLHEGVPDSDPSDAYWYTRDGSYLRLSLADSQPALEYPSGIQHTFEASSADLGRRVIKIDDRQGNGLTIDYQPDHWTITDTHGRTHTVYLDADNDISRVELAAPEGGIATYQFRYTPISAQQVECTATTTTIKTLQEVTGPLGGRYGLDYFSSNDGCELATRLSSIQLPDGGLYRWTYATRTFPDGSAPHQLLLNRVGVATKDVVASSGVSQGTYQFSVLALSNREIVNVITPKLDHHSYHFSWHIGPDSSGWTESTYGLPIDKPNGPGWSGLALQSQVEDCDSAGQNCVSARAILAEYDQDGSCTAMWGGCQEVNRRLKTDEEIYYDDPNPGGGSYWTKTARSDFDGLGHFRSVTKDSNFPSSPTRTEITAFNPEAGTYAATFVMPGTNMPWILDDYDHHEVSSDNGSYESDYCFDQNTGARIRTRKYSGSSRSAHDVVTEMVRKYDGSEIKKWFGGSNQTLGTGQDLCALALSNPEYQEKFIYSFGVLSQRIPLDASGAAMNFKRLDLDIDQNSGLVATKRDVAGQSTSYEYDLLGRRVMVTPGDAREAPTEYSYSGRTSQSLLGGPRLTITRRDGAGLVLDQHTRIMDGFGNVVKELRLMPDGSQAAKRYVHDAMGYLTGESTGWTTDGGGLGNLVTYGQFDPFGRPGNIAYPDGHEIDRNYLGIRVMSKTWQQAVYHKDGASFVERPYTLTKKYDASGNLIYQSQTEYAASNLDGPPTLKSRSFTYDARGSVREVYEDGQLREDRSYNRAGQLQLKRVRLDDDLPNAQWASWSYGAYDAAGNLLARTRTVPQSYSSGTEHTRNLRYEYDAAGRLKIVRDSDFGNVWKRVNYGAQNGTTASGKTDWSKGKVINTQRQAWAETTGPLGGMSPRGVVKYEYEYAGIGGRASSMDTTISIGGTLDQSVSQSVKYTALGNISEINYPTNDQIWPYTASYSYSGGLMSGVTLTGPDGVSEPWVSNISYLPSGQMAERDFGNGMHEAATPDPDGMPRLGSVTVSGIYRWKRTASRWESQKSSWNSGPYHFDGSRSLVGIGSNYSVPNYSDQHTDPYTSGRPFECGERLDPFGKFGSSFNKYCTERLPRQLYDVDGRVVRRSGERTTEYNFYGIDGRVLVNARKFFNPKFSRYEWRYRYLVYSGAAGNEMSGMETRHEWIEGQPWWDNNVSRRFSAGGGRVITDDSAYWLTDPRRSN